MMLVEITSIFPIILSTAYLSNEESVV